MKIISIPVLDDNYIHVLRDDVSETTIVVDPALPDPVIKTLQENQWKLTHIFLTHHHGDHIGGVDGLTAAYPEAETYGFSQDQYRLPSLTYPLADGDELTVARHKFEIWHLPGHTTGHIGFISRDAKIAFTGDVLFGMGCGRLFEGSFEDMYKSLAKFRHLDKETKVYCTHEYTLTNAHFAKSVLPENKKILERLNFVTRQREEGKYTVPLTLKDELETNPFLLAENLLTFKGYREKRNIFTFKPTVT